MSVSLSDLTHLDSAVNPGEKSNGSQVQLTVFNQSTTSRSLECLLSEAEANRKVSSFIRFWADSPNPASQPMWHAPNCSISLTITIISA